MSITKDVYHCVLQSNNAKFERYFVADGCWQILEHLKTWHDVPLILEMTKVCSAEVIDHDWSA